MSYTQNQCYYQEVQNGTKGALGCVKLPLLYNTRREIAAAKVKDLKSLCEYIAVEYRGLYESLQSLIPSSRRLRRAIGQSGNVPSSDEGGASEPSEGSESESNQTSSDSDEN